MDYRLQFVGLQSNPEMEMGSLEERSNHELEDESLISPAKIGQKTNSFHAPQLGSSCRDWRIWSSKLLGNAVFMSIRVVVFSNKLNLLMPFGPLAVLVHGLSDHNGWVFFLTLLGITPLAERLGYATEQLSFYTGDTVGGLLNATFGNATELIISIYALKSGMIRVVQQSLLGSILSNMLLVLGCAFFCGGIVFNNKQQVFNKAIAVLNSGLLLMAVMGLLFPAVLHFTHTEVHFGRSELALSRFSSCIMLLAYAGYLVFQLKSQKDLYMSIAEGGTLPEEGSDDDEGPEISKWESVIWLSILTAWIAILSEYLVDAIEGASIAWKMPVSFISVILLPIVGNAAEHASAIMFAMKDKLDISLGVAIGSSTQISMFAIPFCVVIGWIMGCPMDLNFQLFETATLFITVLVVAFLLQEGTSNYFKGLMLILCYLIVAASFFVHVDPTSVGQFLVKIFNWCPCGRIKPKYIPCDSNKVLSSY
ncbi:vacuolar cation/proton exchanger 5-like isoform X1 [Vitis riparia]|uniref:vacuolar cation/proton exchanger 5-like isoform X1 n=1 Tax=Vitis riparia TaxID=96939 RepID=UPI00155AC309|nr:vacuolar cation/proton exchanger 5-like isoform X1 [Vitis riparia]